jgi:rubredoxin
MSKTVVCEVCGRLYGPDPGDAPLSAGGAHWAALRAGWQRTVPGRWNCGASVCQSAQSGPGPDAA